jgi:hypothetical protein
VRDFFGLLGQPNYRIDTPMPRGVSTKLLAALPATYSSNWLDAIDKRSKIWRAVSERIAALESDSGGTDGMSHAKRSLIRRLVFLELLCETQEMRFVAGELADVGAFTQAYNSMLGGYRQLGLERRQRPLRSLREEMLREEADA